MVTSSEQLALAALNRTARRAVATLPVPAVDTFEPRTVQRLRRRGAELASSVERAATRTGLVERPTYFGPADRDEARAWTLIAKEGRRLAKARAELDGLLREVEALPTDTEAKRREREAYTKQLAPAIERNETSQAALDDLKERLASVQRKLRRAEGLRERLTPLVAHSRTTSPRPAAREHSGKSNSRTRGSRRIGSRAGPSDDDGESEPSPSRGLAHLLGVTPWAVTP